ncbi:MAG TPA: AraC family transcriptional regulator [Solirubrobacteraceae bacterium]|jgi:AraC-like DNA-binding protein|nr:AraC family transcriptional regulator [Solirubrobacteraceae bacterium]
MDQLREVERVIQTTMAAPSRATRSPDPCLRSLIAGEYVGWWHDSLPFARWLEPPHPCLTLMISIGEPLRTDRGVLPSAWIAGLDDRPELVETGGRRAALELKLTPLGAYRLCGMPLRELTGEVVALEDVFGTPGRVLAERIALAPDWNLRFDLLDTFLAIRVAGGMAAHPLVEEAWLRLRQTAGRVAIGALAAELGASRRRLSTLFTAQVGLGPKTAARLLRFEQVCYRLREDPQRWAEIAYDCGYFDQPHMNREFRELAGITPTDFLTRQLPEQGTVGDGVTFIQDRTPTPRVA